MILREATKVPKMLTTLTKRILFVFAALLFANCEIKADFKIERALKIESDLCGSVASCKSNKANIEAINETENGVTVGTNRSVVQTFRARTISELECSCDMTRCFSDGLCCLDALDRIPNIEESEKTTNTTCGSLEYYQNTSDAIGKIGVRMVQYCTTKFDLLTVDKCENPLKYNDIFAHVPVESKNSLVIFKNKFCAACNNVAAEDIISWKLRVSVCPEIGRLNTADTDNLILDIMANECKMQYEAPEIPGLETRQCKIMVSKCNETGKWEQYDSYVEAACQAYTGLMFGKYKNVFCYLCNVKNKTYSSDQLQCIGGESEAGGQLFYPLSALLKLPSPEDLFEKRKMQKNDNKIFDPFIVSYWIYILVCIMSLNGILTKNSDFMLMLLLLTQEYFYFYLNLHPATMPFSFLKTRVIVDLI